MSAGFKVMSHSSPSLSLSSSCHSWGSWKQDQAYKRPGFQEQLQVSCLNNTRKFMAYHILILVPSSVAPNAYCKICFMESRVLNFWDWQPPEDLLILLDGNIIPSLTECLFLQEKPEDGCAIVSKEIRFCSHGAQIQGKACAHLLFQYFHYWNIPTILIFLRRTSRNQFSI